MALDAGLTAGLASLDAVAALKPSKIITGHKDPGAPDDNATRVLDQSRRYIEDFGQAVARSSTPREAVAVMLEKYPAYGKPVHPVRRGIQPVPSLNREFRL